MDDYQQPRDRFGDDQPDSSGAKLVRFELTADLARGSSAAAKQLAWNGTELEKKDALTLTVHDAYTQHGAKSGRQGIAKFCPDANRWEIVELANFRMITGVLKGAMGSGESSWTIDGVSVVQGADPRSDTSSGTEEVTVYNVHNWAGDDDARVVAVWNETQLRWELIQVTCPA